MIKYYVSKEAFLERRRFNAVEYYSRIEARILGMVPRRQFLLEVKSLKDSKYAKCEVLLAYVRELSLDHAGLD
jgi:hypothetical protein